MSISQNGLQPKSDTYDCKIREYFTFLFYFRNWIFICDKMNMFAFFAKNVILGAHKDLLKFFGTSLLGML